MKSSWIQTRKCGKHITTQKIIITCLDIREGYLVVALIWKTKPKIMMFYYLLLLCDGACRLLCPFSFLQDSSFTSKMRRFLNFCFLSFTSCPILPNTCSRSHLPISLRSLGFFVFGGDGVFNHVLTYIYILVCIYETG